MKSLSLRQLLTGLFVLLSFSGHLSAQTYNADKHLNLRATPDSAAGSITLSWTAYSGATNIDIYRRVLPPQADWQLLKSFVVPEVQTASTYTDTTALPGKRYEYRAIYASDKTTTWSPPFATTEFFIVSGHSLPLPHRRGKILIVVDQTIYNDTVTPAINQLGDHWHLLVNDLVSDGWEVLSLPVPRDSTTLSVDNKLDILRSIRAVYAANPDLKALYLLGRTPIMKSGFVNPDGHGIAARAADGFWGEMTGTLGPGDYENWYDADNDGDLERSKYGSTSAIDWTTGTNIRYNPELMVGRVDMAGLTSFSESEVDLLKRYIGKAILWRRVQRQAAERAIVEDNLKWISFQRDSFGSYGGLVGASNITFGDNSDYSDAGSFVAAGHSKGSNDAGGGHSSAGFAKNEYRSIVYPLFGSYSVNWEQNNNLLRSAIAGKGWGLNSMWSGSPFWWFPRVGMGGMLGDAAITVQTLLQYPASNDGPTMAVNLIGDPTTRMSRVPTPINAQATFSGANVLLTWVPSPAVSDPGFLGYYVYRSATINGRYTQLNTTAITTTTYTDTSANTSVDNFYLIRAACNILTVSGRYPELSAGAGAYAGPGNPFVNSLSPQPIYELPGPQLSLGQRFEIRGPDGAEFYIAENGAPLNLTTGMNGGAVVKHFSAPVTFSAVAKRNFQQPSLAADASYSAGGALRLDAQGRVTTYSSSNNSGLFAVALSPDGLSATVSDDTWANYKCPVTIGANTVLEFTVSSTKLPDAVLIGFDNDSTPQTTNKTLFYLGGRSGATPAYANDRTPTEGALEANRPKFYSIRLGDYPNLIGALGNLVLASQETSNTMPAGDRGNVTFSNIRIYHDTGANTAPTAIALSRTSVPDKQPAGTIVGSLSTTDANYGTHTYTLVGGDTGSFAISGINLQTAASLDFETKNSYTVTIRTTDTGGLSFDQTFTIRVTEGDGISVTLDQGLVTGVTVVDFTAESTHGGWLTFNDTNNPNSASVQVHKLNPTTPITYFERNGSDFGFRFPVANNGGWVNYGDENSVVRTFSDGDGPLSATYDSTPGNDTEGVPKLNTYKVGKGATDEWYGYHVDVSSLAPGTIYTAKFYYTEVNHKPNFQATLLDATGNVIGLEIGQISAFASDAVRTGVFTAIGTMVSGAKTFRIEAEHNNEGGTGQYFQLGGVTFATVAPAPTDITYAVWSATFDWGSTPLADREALADANANGIENLMEFAFNLSPTAPGGPATLTPGTGTSGLPAIKDAPPLRIEYVRRKNSVLAYTVQFSSNLADWEDSTTAPVVTPIDGNWERRIITDTATSDESKRFGRVVIVETP